MIYYIIYNSFAFKILFFYFIIIFAISRLYLSQLYVQYYFANIILELNIYWFDYYFIIIIFIKKILIYFDYSIKNFLLI